MLQALTLSLLGQLASVITQQLQRQGIQHANACSQRRAHSQSKHGSTDLNVQVQDAVAVEVEQAPCNLKRYAFAPVQASPLFGAKL